MLIVTLILLEAYREACQPVLMPPQEEQGVDWDKHAVTR